MKVKPSLHKAFGADGFYRTGIPVNNSISKEIVSIFLLPEIKCYGAEIIIFNTSPSRNLTGK
jgi:hypothetical protein